MKRILPTALFVVVAAAALWFGTSSTKDEAGPAEGGADAPARVVGGDPSAGSAPSEPASAAPSPAVTSSASRGRAAAAAGSASSSDNAGDELIARLVAIRAIDSQVTVTKFLTDNAELAKETVEAFCDKAKSIGEDPVEGLPAGERDAAPFLGPRVDWSDPVRKGALPLPPGLQERVLGAKEQWASVIGPSDFAALSFDWMTQLHAYDRWRLTVEAPEGGGFAIAIPNYVPLMVWAKLRLIRGIAAGDVGSASRDVRQLARLIQSNELLLADMVAVAMFAFEREAYDLAVAHGTAPAGWAPPSARDLGARRAVGRVAANFAFPGVDPEVTRRALECAPVPCTALLEASWVHASIGRFSPSDTAASISRQRQSYGCNEDLVRRIESHGGLDVERARTMFEGTNALVKFKARL